METFDFTKSDNHYMYNINLNTILHIKRLNHGVALLYFTDVMKNKINIPIDIVVYTYNYLYKNEKIIQKSIDENYPLCYTDNYTIEYKKIEILSLHNQRKWNILS